jgi:hypothetical protein
MDLYIKQLPGWRIAQEGDDDLLYLSIPATTVIVKGSSYHSPRNERQAGLPRHGEAVIDSGSGDLHALDHYRLCGVALQVVLAQL